MMTRLRADPLRLARSLINTGERDYCQFALADFEDALRRADTTEARDACAQRVIALYTKGTKWQQKSNPR